VEEFLHILDGWQIKPTLFATHDCPIVRAYAAKNPHLVGIHPNPRPGSTQGKDISTVFDGLLRLFPHARAFRSHGYYDSSELIQEAVRRGIHYDSNLCLYLQSGISPLRMGIPGMTRLPVFWEDDVHWLQSGGDWQIRRYAKDFMSPGLKIINVHPFMVVANIPSADYYRKVKRCLGNVTRRNIGRIRYKGAGTQTFLRALVRLVVANKQRFWSLDEIFQSFPPDAGRRTRPQPIS
jgi:hypothetical protein